MGAVVGLAVAGLRARWRPALVLLCCLAVAATTIALGIALRDAADRPWERTFDAANGAHVVASGDAASVARVAAAPEVVAVTGPLAEVYATMRLGRDDLLTRVVEAPPDAAPVDRPLLVDGSPARPGGVVVEATMARTLRLGVGDVLELAPAAIRPGGPPVLSSGPGTALRVAGIAVVVSQQRFPDSQPGLVLVHPSDLPALLGDRPAGRVVLLRLRDPELAGAFAARAESPGRVMTGTWQRRRDAATEDVAVQRVVILTFGFLLLLTAAATAGVLAGGRAVAGAREAALLRAVGLTPRASVAVAVVETAAVALAACVAGWLAALPLAERIGSRAAAALAAPVAVALDVRVLLLVVAVLLPVVCVATALPAVRGARTPSVVALHRGAAARSYGASRVGGWAERRLPFVAVLGANAAAARPARRLLAAMTVVLAVAAAVASAGMEATLDREAAAAPSAMAGFVAASPPDLLRPVAYSLMALLGVTALAGVVATTLAAAAESRRDDALLRAAGATASQLVGRTAWGTALMALAAGLAGLPLGIGLFRASYAAANGDTGGAVMPGAAELLAILLAACLVAVAGAAAVAYAASRTRPAEVLRQV